MRSLVPSLEVDADWLEQDVWRNVSPVAEREIIAQVDWNAPRPLELTLCLECVEQGGRARKWERTYTKPAGRTTATPEHWS